MLKILGLIIVIVSAYFTYEYIWPHGWMGKSAALFVWFLLASLYKPGSPDESYRDE